MLPATSAAIDVLRRSALCQGLSQAELHYLAEVVRPVPLPRGQVLYEQNSAGESMYFVARGRVQATVDHAGPAPPVSEFLSQGDHFGDLDLLAGGQRTATVQAVMDAELLELEHSRFQKLLLTVPRFAANLSRSLAQKLHRQSAGRRTRATAGVIGLVSSTLRTQGLIRPLCHALVEAGDSLAVLTERAERWPAEGGYLLERIPAADTPLARAELVHRRLGQLLSHHHRVLLDLTLRAAGEELAMILRPCETVFWLVEPEYADAARRHLAALLAEQPDLAARAHVVWIMRASQRYAPTDLADLPLARPDFKITLDERYETGSSAQRRSLGRLVRYLHGPRLGLALGGGGARGLAHLGVLRAFEEAGLDFDLVAGTSIGAMIGTSYAANYSSAETLDYLSHELKPHWLVSKIPKGNHWYMWGMFRTGGWERKLRRYAEDARLEQLAIPMSTIAVDLVTGNLVVRDSGPVVAAILESINLPGVARPILRDGMALVDGGILNNLPGDILPPRGADYVIGVDVVSRLPQRFARNVPGLPTEKMRRPGPIDTLLRVHEVQDHGINAFRINAVDFRIAPDTSMFEFAGFDRAEAIAEVGYRAAMDALPRLEALLAQLKGAALKDPAKPQAAPLAAAAVGKEN